MKSVDKIISNIDRQVGQLGEASVRSRKKAEDLRRKAGDKYALPDRLMEHLNKIVALLNGLAMEVNKKAFAEAQVLTRKAGIQDEIAERAARVANKLTDLIK